MFDQAREEMEFNMGRATDAQNALAWNSMNRKPDDTGKIDEALASGQFVIVEEGTEYCPSTDAIMGSRRFIVRSRRFIVSRHPTREAAEAALAVAYPEDGDFDPEIGVYILPYKPTPVRAYLTDADIPF